MSACEYSDCVQGCFEGLQRVGSLERMQVLQYRLDENTSPVLGLTVQ
jgi:hypothetical protein